MAFTEALRLVIDADTSGAVRGIERVGQVSDRELSRSKENIDKWGHSLTNVGATMIGVGGAALFGLGKAAMASEDAQLSVVKLQNTLANMPALAGENSKQFTDLAASIQDYSAADGDAIVEAEALLGTFNLTADQIKSITPLVVDLSRKFGLDMSSAAVQVGKALDGNVTALKRNGISIDEAMFATDRYGAVQKALSDQVGGFAAAEGATFAGSLQRLKNEMGDLAEGVGTGAVDAFSSMFGVVDGLTDRFNELSPGAQNAIGKFATFGATGLVAAGGVSVLIGQIILAHQRFGAAAEGAAALTNKLGGLGSVAKLAGGVIGIGALILAARELNDQANSINVENVVAALLSSTSAAQKGTEEIIKMSVAFDLLDQNFGKVLASSVPAAEAFIRTAESMGVSKEQVDRLKDALQEKKAADEGATAATQGHTDATAAGAAATGDAEAALRSYSEAIKAQFDPLFAAIDAQNGVAEAQQKVNEAVAEFGEGSPQAVAAHLAATEAAIREAGAMDDLAIAVANGDLEVSDAIRTLQGWVAQGRITQADADVTAARMTGVATAAGSIPKSVSTVVSVTGNAISDIESIQARINALRGRDVGIRIVGTAVGVAIPGGGLFHEGGIVPGPRGQEVAAILQAGERVISLPEMDSMRGIPGPSMGGGGRSTTVNYNITVAGGLDNAAAIGQSVVEKIQAYERSNGTGWRQ